MRSFLCARVLVRPSTLPAMTSRAQYEFAEGRNAAGAHLDIVIEKTPDKDESPQDTIRNKRCKQGHRPELGSDRGARRREIGYGDVVDEGCHNNLGDRRCNAKTVQQDDRRQHEETPGDETVGQACDKHCSIGLDGCLPCAQRIVYEFLYTTRNSLPEPSSRREGLRPTQDQPVDIIVDPLQASETEHEETEVSYVGCYADIENETEPVVDPQAPAREDQPDRHKNEDDHLGSCLLYTSDAADE